MHNSHYYITEIAMQIKCFKTIIASLVVILAFTGCATLKHAATPLSETAQQAKLKKLQSWQFSGALSITNHNSNSIVNVNWQQQADHYNITLTSLLNISGVKIIGNKNQITLIKSHEQQISANTPEGLMQKELGWWLPLENVHYWLFGMQAPKVSYHATYYANGALQQLQQQRWQIDYIDYQLVDGFYLPHLMVFNYGTLRLKLVIKKWLLQ
jgi:outer membrane lipoprotein LolB